MKYFAYANRMSYVNMCRMFEAVLSSEKIARARYRGRYPDALDAALFHLIDNYDESRDTEGDVTHYAARVVSTILRGHPREVLSDTVLTIEADSKAFEGFSEEGYSVEEPEDITEEDIRECAVAMLPYFLKDYELFAGNTSAVRKMNYKSIFSSFCVQAIQEAVTRLGGYYDEAKYLDSISKSSHMRNFGPDRYKRSLDNSVIYEGTANGIVICRFSPRARRNVYRVGIVEFVDTVIKKFYTGENAPGKRTILGTDVYVTLSGLKLIGSTELRATLERELVASLLVRSTSLRVVRYEEGTELLVSSSKEDLGGHTFSMFGESLFMGITGVVVRRVD